MLGTSQWLLNRNHHEVYFEGMPQVTGGNTYFYHLATPAFVESANPFYHAADCLHAQTQLFAAGQALGF